MMHGQTNIKFTCFMYESLRKQMKNLSYSLRFSYWTLMYYRGADKS